MFASSSHNDAQGQIPSQIPQGQIPRGVADYFWDEAFARRRLESDLLDLFRSWGYQDVIPPMFEFAETVSQRSSPQLQSELYRFLDRDGSTLTLRSDMTIAIARLVGTRLHDRPMPQRFCYAGSVFRHAETQAGRQREFTQAGFELIGAASPAADAEVIALTTQAMRVASLQDFRIVVGQLHYFHALLQELRLTVEQTALFQSAIRRNSEAELANFLRTTPLRTQQRHTVEQLPLLSGPDPQRVIAHADRLCLNYAMHKALANLREIYQRLDGYGIADQVYLDLTEINNLGYYTGISFEILVPSLGFPIGGGGRYDNLVGTFGAPQPAVGMALGIDRMIDVQRSVANYRAVSTIPVILVSTSHNKDALKIIHEWRSDGMRVVESLDDSQGESLWQAAQNLDIGAAAEWKGDGFDFYGVAPDSPATPTFVPQSDAIAYLKRVRMDISRRSPSRPMGAFDTRSDYLTLAKSNTFLNTQSNVQNEEKYGLRG